MLSKFLSLFRKEFPEGLANSGSNQSRRRWSMVTELPEGLPEKPIVGEKWILQSRVGDPFPTKAETIVTILDVKAGWVRYEMNDVFNDQRMKIDLFMSCYKKIP